MEAYAPLLHFLLPPLSAGWCTLGPEADKYIFAQEGGFVPHIAGKVVCAVQIDQVGETYGQKKTRNRQQNKVKKTITCRTSREAGGCQTDISLEQREAWDAATLENWGQITVQPCTTGKGAQIDPVPANPVPPTHTRVCSAYKSFNNLLCSRVHTYVCVCI